MKCQKFTVVKMMMLAVSAAALLTLAACESNQSTVAMANDPVATGSAGAVSLSGEHLDDRTRDALREALDDERHAIAMYRAVMEKFGNVRPFSNIVRAEERHEAALLRLFRAYRLDVPDDRWADHEFDLPATLAEACAASAKAEEENIAMYDRFLEFVDEPSIRTVFQNLRNASADRHLPAFRRCARRR